MKSRRFSMDKGIMARGDSEMDSPIEKIKRVTDTGNEYWSSRDFAKVFGYSDYRNFEQVIEKAKVACFNSGQRLEDHFGDITEMIDAK